MKSNKAFLIIFFAFFGLPFILTFLMAFFQGSASLGNLSNDYARITEVDYKAVVVDEPGSEGKVIVTERLTFDIHAASRDNLFWELWRDLCEDYVDGVKVHYKVNSVKQIMPDGTEVIYDESPKLYWDDYDYVSYNPTYGPGKWYHSEGPYDEDAAMYECVFFYVDGLYREKVVFEIEYEMYNAALKYNDCSDLYLALYSGETTPYLESFNAQILFPNKDMPEKGNYNVYTYGTNANSFPIEESADKNPGYYTFSVELDADNLKFKPYNQYIEFDLVSYGEDKHIFTEFAPSNYYTYDDVLDEILAEQKDYADTPGKYKVAKIIVLVIAIGGSAAVLIYAFRIDKRMRLKYAFFNPGLDIDFYRDIPSDLDPNFASALAFCKNKAPKDDSGVYSAILLSLARKGYIELSDLGNTALIKILKKPTPVVTPTITPVATTSFESDFWDSDAWDSSSPITTVMEPTPEPVEPVVEEKEYEPLTLCEGYYFDLLLRHSTGDAILMNHFQERVSSDYQNTEAFARNMDKSIVNIGVKEGYFVKADYKAPQRKIRSSANGMLIFGLLIAILANIISYQTRLDFAFGAFFIFGFSLIVGSFYLKKQAPKYVLLTQFGQDEYVKWRGLYNFLNSDTLIDDRSYVELPVWEKYLVYATAFGISEKVIKAISLRCPEASYDSIVNNSYCRSGRIRHSSRSFRSSVRSASFSSGGGGGGFGYGGGGRGGGGGGGGH